MQKVLRRSHTLRGGGVLPSFIFLRQTLWCDARRADRGLRRHAVGAATRRLASGQCPLLSSPAAQRSGASLAAARPFTGRDGAAAAIRQACAWRPSWYDPQQVDIVPSEAQVVYAVDDGAGSSYNSYGTQRCPPRRNAHAGSSTADTARDTNTLSATPSAWSRHLVRKCPLFTYFIVLACTAVFVEMRHAGWTLRHSRKLCWALAQPP